MESVKIDPCEAKENYPVWKTSSWIWEKIKGFLPFYRKYLNNSEQVSEYKNAWVAYNAEYIKCLSSQYGLPPLMLAGIAWKEVGGKPKSSDDFGFVIRSYDHYGTKAINKHFTIYKHPSLTSFGSVSMQLRRAAPYLGIDADYNDLTLDEMTTIIGELRSDAKNLELVCKHLVDLCKVDYKGINPLTFNDEQISVVCTRYNRGPNLSLDQIKKNTQYGNDIIRLKSLILSLISL